MTLPQILVFCLLALAIGCFPRFRSWLLLIASLLAVYWLQPQMPIRNLDFWLPTGSVALAMFAWGASRLRQTSGDSQKNGISPNRLFHLMEGENARTGIVIAGTVLGVASTRYLGNACCLTPTRPPEIGYVLIGLIFLGMAFLFLTAGSGKKWISYVMVIGILGLFLILKSDPLAVIAAAILRTMTGQSPELASSLDIRWLGFSYIAFRLLHVLRDGLAGRLPSMTLREFVIYTVFFPAVAAGPIDRVQRFLPDLRLDPAAPLHSPRLTAQAMLDGGIRIVEGMVKKFVFADMLALFALNGANAAQTRASGWMWLLLYAYAFRIYFDFSGYTDIAIGMSRWMGFQLPENFDRPYLRSNLTLFWNSWHITLAQWFRTYFFYPFTRALRSSAWKLPVWIIILLGQVCTMILIGLWHGITWNFAVWGCWHGLGLFLHNRWSEWNRARLAGLTDHPRWHKVYSTLATLMTFQYVVLGWVWFALPSIGSSVSVFQRLLGFPG
jgi:D-alanyl-lipoteichoic acid acyltransferase DltB (MBOAT superfamily)